jgi:hypothetical protein
LVINEQQSVSLVVVEMRGAMPEVLKIFPARLLGFC